MCIYPKEGTRGKDPTFYKTSDFFHLYVMSIPCLRWRVTTRQIPNRLGKRETLFEGFQVYFLKGSHLFGPERSYTVTVGPKVTETQKRRSLLPRKQSVFRTGGQERDSSSPISSKGRDCLKDDKGSLLCVTVMDRGISTGLFRVLTTTTTPTRSLLVGVCGWF